MIEIGQDAAGAWAWMIFDRHDVLVASGDGLPDRFMAAEVAASVQRGMVTRGEADIDRRIRFTYPDERQAGARLAA